MITRGAVPASTPLPACHHGNTPYTPTLPRPCDPAPYRNGVRGSTSILI